MGEESEVSKQSYVKEEEKKRGLLSDVFNRLIREKPLGTVGLVIVAILFVVGITCELLAPYGMNEIHLTDRLDPPSAKYILGTDHLGRDLLSRIIFGARISMLVALLGSGLAVVVASVIGTISGFFGGKVDFIIQRFVDAWMCFPPLFIFLTIMAVLGPGLGQVIFVLGLARGMVQSRVIRGAVIGVKENVYVEAARAIGSSTFRTLIRHVLPNIFAPIITIFAVGSGYMILSEATLSFLGFGVPPPAPAWGGMLSQAGRQYMYDAPWMALWPGLALVIVVYGLNMFGDALRDLLDPRLRGGLGRYGGFKKKAKGAKK
jgi:peptide/nickel transport system permease protein